MSRLWLFAVALPALSVAQTPADTLALSDGTQYVGAVRDGVPHGEGMLMHAEGWTWQGTWTDGTALGEGTYTLASGRTARARLPIGSAARPASVWSARPRTDGAALLHDLGVSGEVRVSAPQAVTLDGLCTDGSCTDGTGTLDQADGVRYAGAFRDGRPHGTGLVTHPNGWTWLGTWTDGVPARRGRLTVLSRPAIDAALPSLDLAPDETPRAAGVPDLARPNLPIVSPPSAAQRRADEAARQLLESMEHRRARGVE